MNGIYSVGEVVLGKWRLTRKLGSGSYGTVFEATREDGGVQYRSAIKIISIPQDSSEVQNLAAEGMTKDEITGYYSSFAGELSKEFIFMSQLKGNSNIVSYEDHEIVPHSEGIGYDIIIRMELLTPLMDKVTREGMSLGESVRLGIDICKGLQLCEKVGIIHRDIKSENIFVSEAGDFKLGDFGVARSLDKTTGGLSKKGTYAYMAPEVYKEEPYGRTVDIYSLGMVLYRLLNNNRSPLLPAYPAPVNYGDREEALAKRMGGEEIPAPANADAALSYIILKACAYKPEGRYSSAADFRKDLESYLTAIGAGDDALAVKIINESSEELTSQTPSVKTAPKKHTAAIVISSVFAAVLALFLIFTVPGKKKADEGDISQFASMSSEDLHDNISSIVEDLNTMTDDEILEEIDNFAEHYGIPVNEEQKSDLLEFCRSFDDLEPEELEEKIEEIQNTLEKIAKAGNRIQGALSTVSRILNGISRFFSKIGSFFGKK